MWGDVLSFYRPLLVLKAVKIILKGKKNNIFKDKHREPCSHAQHHFHFERCAISRKIYLDFTYRMKLEALCMTKVSQKMILYLTKAELTRRKIRLDKKTLVLLKRPGKNETGETCLDAENGSYLFVTHHFRGSIHDQLNYVNKEQRKR